MNTETRAIPAPAIAPETEAYWQAAREDKLLLKTCKACGEPHYYPRTACPHCASTNTDWLEASGNGVIYSYSVMRRAKTPYALAYVTLDEGPTMMTNIVECDFDALAIGQRVTVTFQTCDDGESKVPMFKPV